MTPPPVCMDLRKGSPIAFPSCSCLAAYSASRAARASLRARLLFILGQLFTRNQYEVQPPDVAQDPVHCWHVPPTHCDTASHPSEEPEPIAALLHGSPALAGVLLVEHAGTARAAKTIQDHPLHLMAHLCFRHLTCRRVIPFCFNARGREDSPSVELPSALGNFTDGGHSHVRIINGR